MASASAPAPADGASAASNASGVTEHEFEHHMHSAQPVWPGSPHPLGAAFDGEGTNFALASAGATAVTLCLVDPAGRETRFSLTEVDGYVWHGYLPGVGPGQRYGYRVDGPFEPTRGRHFNPARFLLDPYARSVSGDIRWHPSLSGNDPEHQDTNTRPFMPVGIVIDSSFDWGDDRPPATPYHETVIYEAHVKGLTKLHRAVPEEHRGTYAGLTHSAVLDHLQRLGVTAVELMPVQHFVHEQRLQELGLSNYWGYSPLSFFAPHAGYAASSAPGSEVDEFKEMVRALHAAGIEVILDVVYNHTGEGGAGGPTLSFRGIDNEAYYRLDERDPRRYVDFTGTGNSLNMRDAHVLQLIMDSLRYWVTEMHVDGFRFDLASALAREFYDVDRLAAFFDLIQQDPVVSRVKLIAEPWDLGPGGYQVGNFPPGWSEWNGRYRDAVRDFWRGAPGALGEFASRLTGSSDLYEKSGRRPFASVNFVTAHDGFTLADLVAYEQKHNEANGEDNRDGQSFNRSWNGGVEGPTADPLILSLRKRQQRNLLATMLLSHGVPMILHGDELGRTQQGNNNAYAQDSALTWIDWDHADEELIAFTAAVSALRSGHPAFHRRGFFSGRLVPRADGEELPDIGWLRPDGSAMNLSDWGEASTRALGVYLNGSGIRCSDLTGAEMVDEDFLLCFNSGPAPVAFTLPSARFAHSWIVVVDTAGDGGHGSLASGVEMVVAAHSLVVLEAVGLEEARQDAGVSAVARGWPRAAEPGMLVHRRR